ncbi:hypothetical protein MTsPCn7_23440 [Altererythrobacter sp. MTPC7]
MFAKLRRTFNEEKPGRYNFNPVARRRLDSHRFFFEG